MALEGSHRRGPSLDPNAARPYGVGMERLRIAARWLAGFAFIAVGVMHFVDTAFFEHIVPPFLPAARWLVWISGVAEILGGLGLLIPQVRRAAGIGLLLLLVAVFPANLYMAIDEVMPITGPVPVWTLWARLPFQLIFAAWVWWVALYRPDGDPAA